jgi:hypothetical protein
VSLPSHEFGNKNCIQSFGKKIIKGRNFRDVSLEVMILLNCILCKWVKLVGINNENMFHSYHSYGT